MAIVQQLLFADVPVLDPDALLWQAAVIAAGGTVSAAQLTAVSNFIAGEKTDGVWAVLDWQFLHDAENVTQATIDLKTRGTAVLINSPTFTAHSGIATDGATSYVILLVPGTNYTLNAGSIGYYQNTTVTAVAGVQMGAFNSTNAASCSIWVKYTDNNSYSSLNDGEGDGGAAAPGTTSGLWIADRDTSSTNALYKDNTLIETANQTATIVVNQAIFLGASNDNSGGTPSRIAAANGAMSFCGGHLSSTLRAAMGTRLATFQAAT